MERENEILKIWYLQASWDNFLLSVVLLSRIRYLTRFKNNQVVPINEIFEAFFM